MKPFVFALIMVIFSDGSYDFMRPAPMPSVAACEQLIQRFHTA